MSSAAFVRVGYADQWVQARGAFSERDAKGYFPTSESDQLTVVTPAFE